MTVSDADAGNRAGGSIAQTRATNILQCVHETGHQLPLLRVHLRERKRHRHTSNFADSMLRQIDTGRRTGIILAAFHPSVIVQTTVCSCFASPGLWASSFTVRHVADKLRSTSAQLTTGLHPAATTHATNVTLNVCGLVWARG